MVRNALDHHSARRQCRGREQRPERQACYHGRFKDQRNRNSPAADRLSATCAVAEGMYQAIVKEGIIERVVPLYGANVMLGSHGNLLARPFWAVRNRRMPGKQGVCVPPAPSGKESGESRDLSVVIDTETGRKFLLIDTAQKTAGHRSLSGSQDRISTDFRP
jgi:hypothetical protein